MAVYQYFREQKIPASIEEIWDFISSPENLKHITPEYLGFEITSAHMPLKMYPGMIIMYKIKPLFNIKMTWVTEITQVKEKEFFVDEQRVGPYKMWHHEHRISAISDGVKMEDILTYQLHLSFIGKLLNELFVTKKINQIFDYRQEALIRIFGDFTK